MNVKGQGRMVRETLLLEGVRGGWRAGEELGIEENITLNSGSRKVGHYGQRSYLTQCLPQVGRHSSNALPRSL